MVPGSGILNSWLAGPRWQLVAASVRSTAWTATKLSERAREWDGEWTTDRHDIRKESVKVNRQFIAQWSKKRERWKALTWVKLKVMGRKGSRNTKVCWSGWNRTSWEVNNTGWAFEALIFRSEKRMTLAQTMNFFCLPSLMKKWSSLSAVFFKDILPIISGFMNVGHNYLILIYCTSCYTLYFMATLQPCAAVWNLNVIQFKSIQLHGSLCKHIKSCLILGAVFIASSMWLGFRIQSNSYLNWEPRRYPIQPRNSENDSDSLYNAENSI